MIVKGLIKTIDFSDNTCTVRLPIFETAASHGEVVLKAVMLIQPGMYNGYVEGDVVFVDFENDKLSLPVIIGKLYRGAQKEEATPAHSSLAVSNLKVSSKAALPIDTNLIIEETTDIIPVDKGITSYKTIADIIKALYKTEALANQVFQDQSEIIANIKVEYLLQPVTDPAPTADNPNWTIAAPTYTDEHHIWQKTTCYNHRGQILSTEIICLSAVASSAVYSLRCSTKVHSGPNQLEDVTVTAMVKLGSEPEIEDTAAKLYYKWGDDGSEQAVQTVIEEELEDGTTKEVTITHTFKILAKQLEEKNLIIIFKHENEDLGITLILNTETIMYSPLATPNLVLSNDTDTILYSAAGEVQTSPSSTATLYLNGDELEATYDWSFINCEGTWSEDNRTVTITSLVDASKAAKAVCTATVTARLFENKQYIREFTVTPTKMGTSIDLQTRYYALIHPDFAAGSIKAPTDDKYLEVKEIDGTSLKRLDQADTEEEIEAARTWGNWSTTPPAHTDKTRTQSWKYWTTVKTAKSDNTVTFSNPIINEDLNGVYALAQGKTTNYYSDTDPAEHYTLKKGDCWFKTTGNNTELEGRPAKGELKQWTGTEWKDIGSEIVANKLTATYINALDITAKKIQIGTDSDLVLYADADEPSKTQIGGFAIDSTKISKGPLGASNSVHISTANMSGTLGHATDTTKQQSATNWRLTVGSGFGVRSTGVLYSKDGVFDGALTPSTAKTGSLGTVTKRWGEIYSSNMDIDGTITSSGKIKSSGVIEATGELRSSGGIRVKSKATGDSAAKDRILVNSSGQICILGGLWAYPKDTDLSTEAGLRSMTFTIQPNGAVAGERIYFKVADYPAQEYDEYYQPVIRLRTENSPNCFWSKAFTIGEGGSGWKSVSLPSELVDSNGSGGNNSKIIAILATGKFPKDVDNKSPDSGDAQGATFYTWWDGTKAYVYNPIARAPSTFVINIVVLGKM